MFHRLMLLRRSFGSGADVSLWRQGLLCRAISANGLLTSGDGSIVRSSLRHGLHPTFHRSCVRHLATTTKSRDTVTSSTYHQWIDVFDSNNDVNISNNISPTPVDGLYGVPTLNSIEDFDRLADECIQKCEEIHRELLSIDPNDSSNIVLKFDALSATLCSVLDPFQFCKYAHEDDAYQEAAQQASNRVLDYASQINSNEALQRIISKVIESPELLSRLTPEQLNVAQKIRREFSDNDLSPEERERFVQLNNQMSNLSFEFHQECAHSETNPPWIPVTKNEVESTQIALLQNPELRRVRHGDNQSGGVRVGDLLMKVDDQTAMSLLQWSGIREFRRKVYETAFTRAKKNIDIIDRLINTRMEFAQLLGKPSYAHMFLQQEAAIYQDPKEVRKFLTEALDSIRPDVEQKKGMLVKNIPDNKLHPWDVEFYTTKDMEERQNLVITLGMCLNAWRLLADKLFGIELVIVPLSEKEKWVKSPGLLHKVSCK
eukprot:TRINITY_DN3981_c0_g1_i2.p1 TRINITY_DN3981_c0_g1~~TRINITY_DN3981_c0_g1_i2.p1  ORF type:complete len:487 (+),score=77.32 TRINITY_DN3981_c0_g1_i2:37-1497(+)